MSLFKGSGVALVTPFCATGIDVKVLHDLINWHIDNGTDAIIISGTTGEASTLTYEERECLYTESVKAASKRIPIIAGTATNNTATSIKYSQLAEACGVDGLLLVTPYYNKCTQKGLIAHFTAIAESVKIPSILYNVPSRTGLNMLPQTVLELSKLPGIVGLKEASADITQITETFRLLPSDFSVYSGNDDHIVPLLALGGHGVITTVGNIIPKEVHDLCQSWFDGNFNTSVQLQFMMNPLVKSVFAEVNPIPIKAAVALLGFEVGSVRLPLTDAEASTVQTIKTLLMERGALSE